MIVPQYKIWYKENEGDGTWTLKESSPFAFLARAIERLTHTKYARMPGNDMIDPMGHAKLKKLVAQILQNA